MAVSEWSAYCAPTMETLTADDSELLDELADVAPPQPLAALLPDVTGPMRSVFGPLQAVMPPRFASRARRHSGTRPSSSAAGRWQLAGFVLLASAQHVRARVCC